MNDRSDVTHSKDRAVKTKRTNSVEGKRKMLIAIVGIITIAVILIAIMIPRGEINPNPNPTATPTKSPTATPTIPPGNTIPLNLNYEAGEKMYYTTINTLTNQINNDTSETEPTTMIIYSMMEILSFDGEKYNINQTSTAATSEYTIIEPLESVSKTSYYDNFIAPGAPDFFLDATNNPSLTEFVTKTQVQVGDTWNLPVSTGNQSYGITGTLTIKFEALQILSTIAGTFSVFKINISSDSLIIHANLDNDPLNINAQNNTKISISGETYLEYGTCRVIKAELRQENTNPANPNRTTIIETEKILAEIKTP